MGFHYKDAPARWRRRPPVSTEASQGSRLEMKGPHLFATPKRNQTDGLASPKETLTHLLAKLILLTVGLVTGSTALAQSRDLSRRPDQTAPLVDQSAQPAPQPKKQPTAAEMSAKETVAAAFLRNLEYEEYELRSAAEAMPAEKYLGARPRETTAACIPVTDRKSCAPLPSK